MAILPPTKESLDENEYEAVIEGYKDDKSPYIASGLYDLFALLLNYRKRMNGFLTKLLNQMLLVTEAWKILIPELKDKHPEYI